MKRPYKNLPLEPDWYTPLDEIMELLERAQTMLQAILLRAEDEDDTTLLELAAFADNQCSAAYGQAQKLFAILPRYFRALDHHRKAHIALTQNIMPRR